MTDINDNDLKKIVKLANLSLNKLETVKLNSDFLTILKLINDIQNCNTDYVEPMLHPLDISQRLRKDEVTEKPNKKQLQEIAPKIEKGLYLVPKIIK